MQMEVMIMTMMAVMIIIKNESAQEQVCCNVLKWMRVFSNITNIFALGIIMD